MTFNRWSDRISMNKFLWENHTIIPSVTPVSTLSPFLPPPPLIFPFVLSPPFPPPPYPSRISFCPLSLSRPPLLIFFSVLSSPFLLLPLSYFPCPLSAPVSSSPSQVSVLSLPFFSSPSNISIVLAPSVSSSPYKAFALSPPFSLFIHLNSSNLGC